MYGLYTDVADTNPLYNDYYGCIRCPAGTYAEENDDKLNCRQCPPGTFGVVRGAVAGYSLLVLAYFGSKLVLELILGEHW